jgi:hypothetical protein
LVRSTKELIPVIKKHAEANKDINIVAMKTFDIKESRGGESAPAKTVFTTYNPHQLQTTVGSTKLDPGIMSMNVTTAKDCPSCKQGLCGISSECYAKKNERQYLNSLAFDKKMQNQWELNSKEELARRIIDFIKQQDEPIFALRFSVAGDVRNQDDIEKMNYIAKKVKSIGVHAYTYTKASNLDWSKTKADTLTLNVPMSVPVPSGHNRYISLPKETIEEKVRQGLKPNERVCVSGVHYCGTNCPECIEGRDLTIYTPLRPVAMGGTIKGKEYWQLWYKEKIEPYLKTNGYWK